MKLFLRATLVKPTATDLLKLCAILHHAKKNRTKHQEQLTEVLPNTNKNSVSRLSLLSLSGPKTPGKPLCPTSCPHQTCPSLRSKTRHTARAASNTWTEMCLGANPLPGRRRFSCGGIWRGRWVSLSKLANPLQGAVVPRIFALVL